MNIKKMKISKVLKMKTLSRTLIAGAACLGVMLAAPSEVFADINGNESRVIAVAGSTFIYNGEYYQATNESLNELNSRLDAADTDLNADQADQAIQKIYENVGTGVSEGYLQKIGGNNQGGGDQGGTTNPGTGTTPGTGTDPGVIPGKDPAVPGGKDPGIGAGAGGDTGTGSGKDDTGTGKGKGSTGTGSGKGSTGTGNSGTGSTGTGNTGTDTGAGNGKTSTGTQTPSGTGTGAGSQTGTASGTGVAATVAAANIPVNPEREALLDKLTGLTAGQRQAVVSDYAEKYADSALTEDEDRKIVQAKLATGEAAIQANGNTGVWNALSESEWYEGIRSDLLNKRPEAENAKNKVVYDSAQNALIVTGEDGNERKLSLNEFFPYGKVSRIFIIMAAAGLILAAAGLVMNLLADGRSIPRQTKSRVKNIAGITGAAALGVNLLLLGLAAGCGMGVLSTNTITQEINTSGFYQYAYETMNAKAQQILMVADYDKDLLSEQLNFNRFQFLCKQQTMDILNGKETLADPGTLQSDIRAALDADAEHGEMVNSAVAEKIMEAYRESLTGYEISFIKEIRDHFKVTIIIVVITAIAAIVIAALTLFRDERYRKSALLHAGIACGAAMLVCLVLFVSLSAGRKDVGVYISPEYLYIFVAQVLEKLKTLCLTVAVVCAGGCIGLTVFSTKMKRGGTA